MTDAMTENNPNSAIQVESSHLDIEAEMSPVNQMFNGRSIFITGASGFIGRVLLEKLLRSYQGIKKVYILMRPKKNMQPAERLNKQLLNVPIFDKIRSMKNGQELLDKIKVVNGDIGEEMLGISEEDLNMMLQDQTLSVVFHSAATVKFDEPLKTSIKFNLLATKTIIELCKRMPNLIALCHVSTAYVNSNLKNNETIKEEIYPMSETPAQVIKMAELMNDNLMQIVKPSLVAKRPNTYTYTKSLGEHLIATEASDLPVAIVRPSIVVAAWKEPTPGWIDNLNGPTGLLLAIGKGLLRSMHATRSSKADLIPVDIVVNCMIASAHYVAKSRGKLDSPLLPSLSESSKLDDDSVTTSAEQPNKERQLIEAVDQKVSSDSVRVPPIFHCTSGDINPIRWGNMEDVMLPIIRNYPSRQVLRYPFGSFKSNKYHDTLTRLFVHFMPALIIDLICMIMGKKRQLLSIYLKLHSAVGALAHFSTTNYNFKSDNIKILEQHLTHPVDKEQLYMDIGKLDWNSFWHDYVLGARRYVLKEEDNSLDEARRSFKRALYLEYAFRTILVVLALVFAGPVIMRSVPIIMANYIKT